MFETERLQFNGLTKLYIADLENLFCNNNLVMKSTLKGRVFTKHEFDELLITHFAHSNIEKTGFKCIITKKEKLMIGVTGLLECPYFKNKHYEFGFILNENFWKKGFATEIGKFWLNYAKHQMNLKTLVATVSPKNKASQRVLKKLDMQLIKSVACLERGERLVFKKTL